MLNKQERKGRKKRSGFYEYEGDEKRIWRELTELYPTIKKEYDRQEITERLLFVQVLEAAWCRQEEVITSAPEANLGSVFGWGFPSFKGGVFQFVKNYGQEEFIKKCKSYEKKYGPRFKVPKILKKVDILE